jgi:hypothetical protein
MAVRCNRRRQSHIAMFFPSGSDLVTILLSKQNVDLLPFPAMLIVGAGLLGQGGV